MKKFCPRCERHRETRQVEGKETYTVRGREITVPVAREICRVCGEEIGSDEQDQCMLDAVYAEYRKQVGLLSPRRISHLREKYGLSQRAFAALLGMSQATINRYENGALPQQTHNDAIAACKDPDHVRKLLRKRGDRLTARQRERAEAALGGGERVVEKHMVEIDDLEAIASYWMPCEVSERTGYRRFDFRRFAAAVLWLCKGVGPVFTTAINKLIFYADFLNFKSSTLSLTGAAYRKLPYGPSLAAYDALLDLMESEGFLVSGEEHFPNGATGKYYCPGPAQDSLEVEFSEHEQRVLNAVIETFGEMNATQISERSHKEAAWLKTPEKELISYSEAKSLSVSLQA